MNTQNKVEINTPNHNVEIKAPSPPRSPSDSISDVSAPSVRFREVTHANDLSSRKVSMDNNPRDVAGMRWQKGITAVGYYIVWMLLVVGLLYWTNLLPLDNDSGLAKSATQPPDEI